MRRGTADTKGEPVYDSVLYVKMFSVHQVLVGGLLGMQNGAEHEFSVLCYVNNIF